MTGEAHIVSKPQVERDCCNPYIAGPAWSHVRLVDPFHIVYIILVLGKNSSHSFNFTQMIFLLHCEYTCCMKYKILNLCY